MEAAEYEYLNKVFGVGEWAFDIISITPDYCEQNPDNTWDAGTAAVVKITLSNGSYHEDLGYGNAMNKLAPEEALEESQRKAVADAVKRVLRNYGDAVVVELMKKNNNNNKSQQQQQRNQYPIQRRQVQQQQPQQQQQPPPPPPRQ